MEPKIQQTNEYNNKNKKKQTCRYKEPGAYQWGEGKGRGKIHPPTQGVQSVCYINNNYEWNITFENCEFKKESK